MKIDHIPPVGFNDVSAASPVEQAAINPPQEANITYDAQRRSASIPDIGWYENPVRNPFRFDPKSPAGVDRDSLSQNPTSSAISVF